MMSAIYCNLTKETYFWSTYMYMMNSNGKKSQLPHQISSIHPTPHPPQKNCPNLKVTVSVQLWGSLGNLFMLVLFKVCYIQNLNIPRIAQYLKYCSKIAKLNVNIILLLLRVWGHPNVSHLYMASYIYMQNLNEISQVIFIILYENST